jgi:hypothetical protein
MINDNFGVYAAPFPPNNAAYAAPFPNDLQPHETGPFIYPSPSPSCPLQVNQPNLFYEITKALCCLNIGEVEDCADILEEIQKKFMSNLI